MVMTMTVIYFGVIMAAMSSHIRNKAMRDDWHLYNAFFSNTHDGKHGKHRRIPLRGTHFRS